MLFAGPNCLRDLQSDSTIITANTQARPREGDGLGEIANMLSGAWKSRIPALNGSCFLSVPTVVTGTQYEVRKRSSAFRFTRSYKFNDYVFTVTIHGETP